MNLKRNVSVAVVAVGLMCGAVYAQAEESAKSAPGSPYAGAFGGVVDLSVRRERECTDWSSSS